MGGEYSISAAITFQLTGFRQFGKAGFDNHTKEWNPKDLDVDLSGQVVLITGANSGLGYETALELAKKKATIIMICRNKERGEEAKKKIIDESGNDHVELTIVDVSRPTEVKTFCDNYVKSDRRLDVLVNNAGILNDTRKETPDGLEQVFATNSLSTFLMTEYLMPVLEKSAPSRVINVSSGGMYTTKMRNYDWQFQTTKYDGYKAYNFSKRHQLYLPQVWTKKYGDKGITFNAMHPGWARTPGTQSQLPKWFDSLNLRSQKEGADTIVWLAAAKAVEKDSGKFWFDRKEQPTDFSKATMCTNYEIERMYELFQGWLGYAATKAVPKVEEEDEIAGIATKLLQGDGLKPGQKRFLGMKFEDVFSGTDLMKWMEDNLEMNKEQAKNYGGKLLSYKYIAHKSSDKLPFTAACFYSFTPKATSAMEDDTKVEEVSQEDEVVD